MNENNQTDDAAETAKYNVRTAAQARRTQSAAKAKAELEEDVERLTVALNTHKFITVLSFVALFDAYIFTLYDNWAAPICMIAIEFVGLFVLARHLEIIEAVQFISQVTHLLGKAEKDPSGNE